MKRNIETKFTLSGVIISVLMTIICVFLGFILDDIRGWRNEAMDLNKEINHLVAQNKIILNTQVEHDEQIGKLLLADVRDRKEIDTIKIIINGALAPMLYEHEGRIIKLENKVQ